MPLYQYSPSELEPRRLTGEEIENPKLVIDDFFEFAHLPEVREFIWEWIKVTAIGNFHELSAIERSNLLYLYEKIGKLIEAVHIIYKDGK